MSSWKGWDNINGRFVQVRRNCSAFKKSPLDFNLDESIGKYSIAVSADTVVLMVNSSGLEWHQVLYGERVCYIHMGNYRVMSSEEVEEWANAQTQV